MTERIKYSTAYIHEFAAKIEEMIFSGYRVDHSSAFCAKRRGSAYEIHFIPTREVVDFDDYFPWTEEEEQALTKLYQEMAEKRVAKSSGSGKAILNAAFENLDNEESCNHIDRKAVEELNQLTIQQKWQIDDELDAEFDKLLEQSEPLPKELLDYMEDLRDEGAEEVIETIKKASDKLIQSRVEEALNELAQQSQELGMYKVDNGIFDRLVESIESAQSNPEGCVSTIVEVDKEQVKVYSKSELDEMHWNELKPILDAAGIRGRRRANLIRDFLKWQEQQ